MQSIPLPSAAATAELLGGATASWTLRGETAAAAGAGEAGGQRAMEQLARAGVKIA